MGKGKIVLIIILFIIIVFIFYSSVFVLSFYYKNKINSELNNLPIFSDKKRCLIEDYEKEQYFMGGPVVEGAPYSDPSKTCYYLSDKESIVLLETYEKYFLENGWIYGFLTTGEHVLSGDPGECWIDNYEKNAYRLRVSDCNESPIDRELNDKWQKLISENPKKIPISIRLYYNAENDIKIRILHYILISIILIVIILIIVYIRDMIKGKES